MTEAAWVDPGVAETIAALVGAEERGLLELAQVGGSWKARLTEAGEEHVRELERDGWVDESPFAELQAAYERWGPR